MHILAYHAITVGDDNPIASTTVIPIIIRSINDDSVRGGVICLPIVCRIVDALVHRGIEIAVSEPILNPRIGAGTDELLLVRENAFCDGITQSAAGTIIGDIVLLIAYSTTSSFLDAHRIRPTLGFSSGFFT